MRLAIHLVLVILAFTFVSSPVAAQCAPMPGTGCAGQGAPSCDTLPLLNTHFVWRCPPSCGGAGITQMVMVGVPLAAPIPLLPPATCGTNPCLLACDPVYVAVAPGASLFIPERFALIGFDLCLQCVCLDASAPCFELTQGVRATIY